jgi:CRP/FNR family transcriptional regulator
MRNRLEVLRGVPFLRPLDEETLREVDARCSEKIYLKNETLFLEGDPPKGLFVIREGSVKIYKIGETGREQILEIEGPGRSVAELPLFDGQPYPASCAAIEDSILLVMPARDFHALVERHPALSRAIIASLSQRLRRMVRLVQQLSLEDVRGRLAHLLLELAGPADHVDLPWTQQELASRIGTVREIVSRTLTRMAQEGIVRIEGRRIHLLDRARLRSGGGARKPTVAAEKAGDPRGEP